MAQHKHTTRSETTHSLSRGNCSAQRPMVWYDTCTALAFKERPEHSRGTSSAPRTHQKRKRGTQEGKKNSPLSASCLIGHLHVVLEKRHVVRDS